MLAGLLTASSSALFADENDFIPSTLVEVPSVKLDGYDSSFYGLFRVSNNGKYAVASDSEDSYAGVLWERESNDITFVNNYTGEKSNGVILSDVADDGMMVGAYPALVTSEDGSEYYCWHPGYKYIDGEWVDLPLPENTNLKYPLDMDYCSYAVRVSSDSRIVLGEIYIMDENSKSHWEPMQWFLDENGELIGTQMFGDMDFGNVGFQAYDMTDDGSVIVGMITSIRGDMQPAMIRDGELKILAGPELVNVEGELWWEFDENGEVKEWWWEGIANCIDKDGNVYYYYFDGDGEQHNIVENIYTGEKTEYDDIVACGTGGLVLGMSKVLASDKPIDISALYTALNVSDDGTVIAGGGVGTESYGYYFNYPALIVLEESPITSSIKAMKLDGINISREGNTISISGDYDKAELINAAGMQVASSKGNLDLSGMANGMYIIKISKGNTTKVYKICFAK